MRQDGDLLHQALDVLAALRRIEEREALETAHRVRQRCSKVFRYAVATGGAERDITADLRGAVPPPQVLTATGIRREMIVDR